jgi:hypothetical protein
MELDDIKKLFESGRINFLFGSGLSIPYLSTLGSIEERLTELNNLPKNDENTILTASVYRQYFNNVIWPNHKNVINHLTGDDRDKYSKVLHNYESFLGTMNLLVAKRQVPLLSKKINIFSTNIDMFIERASCSKGIELNDGFRGHMDTRFDEDNFSKILSKESLHYQKVSEIPTFNYIKIHGSSNWIDNGTTNEITSDDSLEQVKRIKDAIDELPDDDFINVIDSTKTIDELTASARTVMTKDSFSIDSYKKFMTEYEKIVMVNPNKRKFSTTVLDMHFYELLRLFSNALEQPNALLLVAGFSFADEHIAQMTVRAANNNPTLQIIVFSYESGAKTAIINNLSKGGSFRNNNVKFLAPEDVTVNGQKINDLDKFDLESITDKILNKIANSI